MTKASGTNQEILDRWSLDISIYCHIFKVYNVLTIMQTFMVFNLDNYGIMGLLINSSHFQKRQLMWGWYGFD